MTKGNFKQEIIPVAFLTIVVCISVIFLYTTNSVTEEYIDTPCSEILKDIVAKYLTGFTVTNVETSTTDTNVTWNNKPLYDCILDLVSIAEFDCYVDSNKDFHFRHQLPHHSQFQ